MLQPVRPQAYQVLCVQFHDLHSFKSVRKLLYLAFGLPVYVLLKNVLFDVQIFDFGAQDSLWVAQPGERDLGDMESCSSGGGRSVWPGYTD